MKNAKNRRKREKKKRSSLDIEWRKGLSKSVRLFYNKRGLSISEEEES